MHGMTLIFLISCSGSAELPEVDARRLAVESGMIDADDPTAQVADVVIAELDGVPPEEVVIRTLHVVERIEPDGIVRQSTETRHREQIQAFVWRDGWRSVGTVTAQDDWTFGSELSLEVRSLRAVDIEGDGIHELLLTHASWPAGSLALRTSDPDWPSRMPPCVWLMSWSESGWQHRIDVALPGSVGVFDTDNDGTMEIAVLNGWEILLFGYLSLIHI